MDTREMTVQDTRLADYAQQALWSQVLPGLWQGGTHRNDELGNGNQRRITKDNFDAVYTMSAFTNPAHRGVKEVRFAINDAGMEDFNPQEDLYPLVLMAHNDWKSGRKVLIRCQAGWNRSGLLMALVLIREGYEAKEAIRLIRNKRSPHALCNDKFVSWLESVDPEVWRN
jgi:protein-tyrosine phosphatase